MQYVKAVAYRHALSVGVAVMAATLMNVYASYSQEGWMVLAALLVCQTTRGTPLKQELYFSLIIFIGIAMAAILRELFPAIFIMQSIAIGIFIFIGWMLFIKRPFQNITFFTMLLFPLVLLIAMFIPMNMSVSASARLMDAMMGAIIGMVAAQLILPVRPYYDFVEGLLPILHVLRSYAKTVGEYLQDTASEAALIANKRDIEIALQGSRGIYPEWVYEVGFNPGLRSGFRFFLIHLERITEHYIVLNSMLVAGVKSHLSSTLLQLMADVASVNAELTANLIDKLQGKPVYLRDDLSADTVSLDAALASFLPGGLDLISVTEEYIQIAEAVRDLKDARLLLMQLLLSLPEKR